MIQFTKKLSIFGLVLTVSWLGVVVGQNLTRHVLQATAYAAPNASDEVSPSGDRYQNLELFQKVLHFVESNYVEPVKNKDLIQGAIKGMLETLDPHSNFLPSDVFKDMKI